jgi:rhodanese-related sulfurtransferase
MKKKNNNFVLLGAVGIAILALFTLTLTKSSSGLLGSDFINKYNSTSNSMLLDVRTPSEFLAGHIDKAINIDFENQTFLSEIKKLDVNKTYFVYCRSGNRSGQAISLMKANGIKNIYELQGGIVSNKDSVTLVTTNNNEPEYVVDASDMVNGQALISGIKKSELTEKEKLGLIQMREEEKLARDVYTTLGSIWGTRIFSNIASSEQTHTDAIKVLLTRYDIKDPVTSDTVGLFTSKAMQDLYNKLTAQGKISSAEALNVGATIEDLDIHDLDTFKNETTKEDILLTYNNLQKGSRNHMRAFVRVSGGNYTPKYISQSDYSSIISSPQERGRQ